ncbi:variant sh3 domain-containing protein [Ceratocystis lukuohia]|uniref:Variant sh3 domain-containing protein n=1 Tax=Ceratocystis lukuohia TaxID=2019550 RepID=A0ABR4MK72_9PEZI
MAAPPPLPTTFPCWCRAVYSWGGEGKRDLGFMEGDLIECLNAGDGSWWTGRLYRDRRTVGSFPSNFVEVLPESFRPMTRSVSPLPANNTPVPGATGTSKNKSFRKPFEAYAKAPHYTTAKQPVTHVGGGKEPIAPKKEAPPPKTVSLARKSRDSAPNSSPAQMANRMNTTYGNNNANTRSAGPHTTGQSYGSNNRAVSPAPPLQTTYVPRSVSPVIHHQGYTPSPVAPPSRGYSGHEIPQASHGYVSREASPAVQGYHNRSQSQYMSQGNSSVQTQYRQNSASPAPGMQNQQSYYRGSSPAPPAPQQQMVPYNSRRSVSPAPPQQNYMSRSHSPAPFSQYDQRNMRRSVSPAPTQAYHSNGMQRSASPVPPHDYYGGSMQRSVSPAPSQHQYRNNSIQGSASGSLHDPYGNKMQRSASPAPLQNYYGNGMNQSVSPAPQHPQYHKNTQQSGSSAPPPSQYYNDGNMRRSRSPAPFTTDYAMDRSGGHYRPESRGVSPGPNNYNTYSRAASPAPLNSYSQQNDQYRRGASPAPLRQNSYDQRSISPAPPPPSHQNTYMAQSPSPAPSPSRDFSYQNDQRFRPYSPQPPTQGQQLQSSSDASGGPPPPPPPHRHMARQGSATSYMGGSDVSRQVSNTSNMRPNISRQGSQASYDRSIVNQMSRNGSQTSCVDPQSSRSNGPPLSNGRFRAYSAVSTSAPQGQNRFQPQTPRSTSPMPPPNLTPSPLREAMDGVMEQLETLRMSRVMDGADPEAHWSPESLEMVSRQSRKESNARPQTAMGLSAQDSGYETWSAGSSQAASQNDKPVEKSPLPELSSYVERMEKSLEQMHQQTARAEESSQPPQPIKKTHTFDSVQLPTSTSKEGDATPSTPSRKIRARKSAYDILNRTFTTKTTATNASSTTQSTTTTSTSTSDRSLMSGASAGALSATSAGSFERHRGRAQSALGVHETDAERPDSPFTGVTYHSSHASNASPTRPQSQLAWQDEAPGLGGLVQPKTPKRSIFKKLLDSAKTGVASGRSSIAFTGGDKSSPTRNSPIRGGAASRGLHTSAGNTANSGGSSLAFGSRNSPFGRDAARDMGANKSVDWVQVRRDVNRSNSLSRIERNERMDRARMLDYPAINAVDELYSSMHGDEGADGNPVQNPIHVPTLNLNLVDKNSRFLANIPSSADAAQIATGYVCRPYRSDVQKLRAIFTWVSEKICWEEAFEGAVDTRRTLETKRGCSEEYATLVIEMCQAVGIECELVHGYLKTPGEGLDAGNLPRSNHWWNAVVVDGEWRMMDTCLASPSNPSRAKYSSIGSSSADFFWFLTPPSEICWTHIPEHHGHQHFCQPVAHDVLFNLPTVCPPFFRSGIEMADYNSSVGRIQGMEMVQLKVNVPSDIELAAEVEVSGFSRDNDGDMFENGEIVHKRALAQAEWYNGVKRYTIKALLPGDEGFGVLKVYAGKRGLMHTIRDIPHPLAFAIPIVHSGENPPYDFVTRHPTPHAQRHDIYVVQPQCQRLALNNTFVFAIRQHPSTSYTSGPQSVLTPSSNPDGGAQQYNRPGSAMSISAASSNPSSASGTIGGKKPAKLAIQTPGGKILRLMRKEERKGISTSSSRAGDDDTSDGGTWETIIKCSETGTWRGLVLADRTARWCVFAEWTCL